MGSIVSGFQSGFAIIIRVVKSPTIYVVLSYLVSVTANTPLVVTPVEFVAGAKGITGGFSPSEKQTYTYRCCLTHIAASPFCAAGQTQINGVGMIVVGA